MPRIIGLTGGVASGKTTVASLWSGRGVTIIDADAVARDAVAPGRPALWLLRRHFGSHIVRADGSLDREALGRIVFSNDGGAARRALNRRTHPFIIAEMLARLAAALLIRWSPIVVLDTPLLFETRSLLPFCSRTVVVKCAQEQQVERMLSRDAHSKGLTLQDVHNRLQSQMPLAEKARLADVVIDNSGSREELEEKAMQALDDLRPSPVGEVVFRAVVCTLFARVLYRLMARSSAASA